MLSPAQVVVSDPVQQLLAFLGALAVIGAAFTALITGMIRNYAQIAELWRQVNQHDRQLNGGLNQRIDERIARSLRAGRASDPEPIASLAVGRPEDGS